MRRERVERGHRRLEEVIPTRRRDEAREQLDVAGGVSLDRERAVRSGLRGDGILAGSRRREVSVVDPVTLHELELPRDRALVTDEEESTIIGIRGMSTRIARRRARRE